MEFSWFVAGCLLGGVSCGMAAGMTLKALLRQIMQDQRSMLDLLDSLSEGNQPPVDGRGGRSRRTMWSEPR